MLSTLGLIASLLINVVMWLNRRALTNEIELLHEQNQGLLQELERTEQTCARLFEANGKAEVNYTKLLDEKGNLELDLEQERAKYRDALQRARRAEAEDERHKTMLLEDAKSLAQGGDKIVEMQQNINQLEQRLALVVTQYNYAVQRVKDYADIIQKLQQDGKISREAELKHSIYQWPPQANEGVTGYTWIFHLN